MIDVLQHIDRHVFLFLNNLGNQNWDWFWLFVTDKWSSLPLYVFLVFMLYKKTGVKSALFTSLMIVGLICFTDQFSNVLKSHVQRLRPCQHNYFDRSIARCGYYGFPSAHAFSSMATAWFVGLILKRHYRFILTGLIMWSLILGYSRIYVGVHYPGDVLAGFGLGTATGVLFFKTRQYLVNQVNRLKIFKEEQAPPFHHHLHFLQRWQTPILWGVFGIITFLYIRTELHLHDFILEDTPNEIYYEMVALAVSLIGFAMRLTAKICQAQIRPKNQGKRSIPPLCQRGVYATMRHPVYVGNFLLLLGPVLWTGNYAFILLFVALYWILYTEIVEGEEQQLRDHYGKDYEDWAQHTPAYCPRLTQFTSPKHGLFWRHILCKHIGILFLLLLVYSGFNILGELIESDDFSYYYSIISLCALTGVLYGFSWFIRRHKQVVYLKK